MFDQCVESYDKLADKVHDQYAEVVSRLAVIEAAIGIGRDTTPAGLPSTQAEEQARAKAERIVAAAETRARVIADAVYAQSFSIIAAAHGRARQIAKLGPVDVDMTMEMEELDEVKDRITHQRK